MAPDVNGDAISGVECVMATPLHSVAATGEGIAMSEAPLSFDGFFQDQCPRLFATMCLTTGSRSDAEELTQDAFVRVLERWDRVGGLEEPAGFLYRTAMNLFKRRYRRARTLDRLPIPSKAGDDAFATIDDRDTLIRAMRELTPRQRAAVVLTSILDVSSEEAGRILGISDSTVRVLTSRAKTAMRAKVRDDEPS
jgi:RNA polymerase sigma-70 factor, ECF subfamily